MTGFLFNAQKLYTMYILHTCYITSFVSLENTDTSSRSHHIPLLFFNFYLFKKIFLAATALANFTECWGPVCYLVTFLCALGPWAFFWLSFPLFVWAIASLGSLDIHSCSSICWRSSLRGHDHRMTNEPDLGSWRLLSLPCPWNVYLIIISIAISHSHQHNLEIILCYWDHPNCVCE